MVAFDRFPQIITYFDAIANNSEIVLQLVDIIGDILTYISYLFTRLRPKDGYMVVSQFVCPIPFSAPESAAPIRY